MSAASMAGRLTRHSRASGKKNLQSERGPMVTKWATWAKANTLGATTVSARSCSQVLSLKGSILQKMSDVLKLGGVITPSVSPRQEEGLGASAASFLFQEVPRQARLDQPQLLTPWQPPCHFCATAYC